MVPFFVAQIQNDGIDLFAELDGLVSDVSSPAEVT